MTELENIVRKSIEASKARLIQSGVDYKQAQYCGVGILDAMPLIQKYVDEKIAEKEKAEGKVAGLLLLLGKAGKIVESQAEQLQAMDDEADWWKKGS